MKIRYWGTAAAEGIPALFCNCAVCREARLKGGKYVRTRSQLIVDDELMVDFNADAYSHALKYGFNMADIQNILITHVHEDHYYPMDLQNRKKGYSHEAKYSPLILHGSEDLEKMYKSVIGVYGSDACDELKFDALLPYRSYKIGSFDVIPLPATHGTPHPYVYILQKNGKTAFILNDSGVPCEEVFGWLKESGIRFDLVSYDCTMGNLDTIKAWGANASHMGIPNILEVRRRFEENGNYKSTTADIITHFSHNGESVGYGDIEKLARSYGFIATYDGMTVEI